MSATTSAPQLKSVRARGAWQGSMRTESEIRSFTLATDEPEAVGGHDTAPTPMEMVAAAVGGCLSVVIETIAAELALSLRSLETTSHAHLDIRGFHGTAEVSPHFEDYQLTVDLDIDGTEEARAELRRLSEKRCPALNLLRDADVDLTVDWRFADA